MPGDTRSPNGLLVAPGPPIYDRVGEGRTEILLREIAIPPILHRGPGGGSPPDKMPIYRLPRTDTS